jgi:hypothetical protein
VTCYDKSPACSQAGPSSCKTMQMGNKPFTEVCPKMCGTCQSIKYDFYKNNF